MKRHFLLVITLGFFILQACGDEGFQQDLRVEQTSNSFHRKVDSIVVDKMNAYNIPGLSIGLVKGDSIVYSKGYGVKNVQTKTQVNNYTIFHTASISKLFTAQAVMILIDQNKLSLDTKLVEVLPELNYDNENLKDITIKSLLNHTSGLVDVSNYHWENNNQSEDSLRDYILNVDLELKAEPHTTYHYSNLGYNILGYIVEKVSGTNFDLLVKEQILIPSQMYDSDFRYFKIADSLKSSPHSKRFLTNSIYVRDVYPYTREQAPGSTLNSSAYELSQWMIAFLNSFSGTNKDNIYSTMLKPNFEPYPYIGLGFQLSKINSKLTVGHFGGDKGFRGYLIMIPEEKIGLVLLANCDYEEDFRQDILHNVAKLMLKN